MKISIKKSELLKGINIVQKAIPSKAVMPILKGILLIAEKDKLKLIANDMQISIETCLHAEVMQTGSIVIDSKTFGEIVRRIRAETVEISVNEKQEVMIKCEDIEMKIIGFNSKEFPEIPVVKEEDFIVIDESVLSKIIKQTVFAVSKTEALSIITGELIEIENSNITMVATDMYRVAIRKHNFKNTSNRQVRAIIPGNSLSEIYKLISEEGHREVKIALEEKHALFVIDKTKFVTRLLHGDYLNYEATIPKEFTSIVRLKTNELLYALEMASIFAQDKLVRLSITDEMLRISSHTEIGNIVKEVGIELDGEDLEIGFNIQYLIEVLKVVDCEEIELCFSSSVTPGLLRTIEDSHYEYLVLPVRMHKN